MTEFELLEVLDNFSNQMMLSTTLFFTLISAYLIITYLVGEKLARRQVVIISALYFVWILTLPLAQYNWSLQAATAVTELTAIGSAYAKTSPDILLAWSRSFMALQYFAILVSLYFMWHVRHAKAQ